MDAKINWSQVALIKYAGTGVKDKLILIKKKSSQPNLLKHVEEAWYQF